MAAPKPKAPAKAAPKAPAEPPPPPAPPQMSPDRGCFARLGPPGEWWKNQPWTGKVPSVKEIEAADARLDQEEIQLRTKREFVQKYGPDEGVDMWEEALVETLKTFLMVQRQRIKQANLVGEELRVERDFLKDQQKEVAKRAGKIDGGYKRQNQLEEKYAIEGEVLEALRDTTLDKERHELAHRVVDLERRQDRDECKRHLKMCILNEDETVAANAFLVQKEELEIDIGNQMVSVEKAKRRANDLRKDMVRNNRMEDEREEELKQLIDMLKDVRREQLSGGGGTSVGGRAGRPVKWEDVVAAAEQRRVEMVASRRGGAPRPTDYPDRSGAAAPPAAYPAHARKGVRDTGQQQAPPPEQQRRGAPSPEQARRLPPRQAPAHGAEKSARDRARERRSKKRPELGVVNDLYGQVFPERPAWAPPPPPPEQREAARAERALARELDPNLNPDLRQVLVIRGADGKLGIRFVGTTITSVADGSTSHAAGLQPGMEIVTVNGTKVRTEEEAAAAFAGAGQRIDIILRCVAAPTPAWREGHSSPRGEDNSDPLAFLTSRRWERETRRKQRREHAAALHTLRLRLLGGNRPARRYNNPEIRAVQAQDIAPFPCCPKGRKALLIGVDYKGQGGELKGCAEAVRRAARRLRGAYDVRVLVDDGRSDPDDPAGEPTRAGIIGGLQWLTEGLRRKGRGTAVVVFAGHGGQQVPPSRGGRGGEGVDETLCPCDYASAGMLSGDDLRAYFLDRVPPGNRVIAVIDCKRPSTVLDLPYYAIEMGDRNTHMTADQMSRHNIIGCDAVLFSGCCDRERDKEGDDGVDVAAVLDPQKVDAGATLVSSLIAAAEQHPAATMAQLLWLMRRWAETRGSTLVPQLSASRAYDLASCVDLFPASFKYLAGAGDAASHATVAELTRHAAERDSLFVGSR